MAPLAPSRGYLLGPPHSEQRPPAPGFSAAQGRTPSRALPPRRPRTVPAAAPRSSSLHDVTPAHLLVTSAPTVARGGRLGEQKAANLRVSTLVTRLPRNSWFWKNRQTCGGAGSSSAPGSPHPAQELFPWGGLGTSAVTQALTAFHEAPPQGGRPLPGLLSPSPEM